MFRTRQLVGEWDDARGRRGRVVLTKRLGRRGWAGRALQGPADSWPATAASGATTPVAQLLPPLSCTVAFGSPAELERRRRRCERFCRQRLVAVEVTPASWSERWRRQGVAVEVGVVWIAHSALVSLSEGGRAVAPQVALAALSALVPASDTVGVYWEAAGVRVVTWARSGRVVAPPSGGQRTRWFLVTEPTPAGWQLIERDGSPELLSVRNSRLPRSAWARLATGAALAIAAPGSFPPLPSRLKRAKPLLRHGVTSVAVATGVWAAAGWSDVTQDLERLRTEKEELRRSLEAKALRSAPMSVIPYRPPTSLSSEEAAR